MLQRTVKALVEAKIREILMVVQFEAEKIKTFFGNGERYGCEIRYVKQRRLGGTADAVKACESELRNEERFIIVYGDNYYDPRALSEFVRSSDSHELLIWAAKAKDSSQFGTLNIRGGKLISIREKVSNAADGLVNGGVYGLDNSIFPAIRKTPKSKRGEFELTDSLAILLAEKILIRAIPFAQEDWVGVSYPWDLLEANRLALDSNEEEVRDGVAEAGVHTKGVVTLSKGCLVKSGTYIEGPVFIGEDTVVGPNAYLRPGTSLGKRVKVGAGCEVKNSIVMDDARIPHLCYVGDSILGKGVSLGAGTITANLKFNDSSVISKVKGRPVDTRRRKLGAILGEGVKTGINTSLFPGVKIGSDAWIGPGAAIKADVPADARVR